MKFQRIKNVIIFMSTLMFIAGSLYFYQSWLSLNASHHEVDMKLEEIARRSKRLEAAEKKSSEIVKELEQNARNLVVWAMKERKLESVLKVQKEDLLSAKGTFNSEYDGVFFAPSYIKFPEVVDGALDHLERAQRKMTHNMSSLLGLNQTLIAGSRLASAIPSIMPAKGWLSSGYGYRKSPFTGRRTRHLGVDIAARKGEKVYATADGVVTFAGWKGGYGRLVIINHGFSVTTRYGHNERILVKKGDQVKQGQPISTVGMSGRTTGPHVHYEVLIADQQVNPKRFLKGNSFSRGNLAGSKRASKQIPGFTSIGGIEEEPLYSTYVDYKTIAESAVTASKPLESDFEVIELFRDNLKFTLGLLCFFGVLVMISIARFWLRGGGLSLFYFTDYFLAKKNKVKRREGPAVHYWSKQHKLELKAELVDDDHQQAS